MCKPHVFFLTGDSGIGKSTLLMKLIKQEQFQVAGFFVHRVLNDQNETEGFSLCNAQAIYENAKNREGTWFIWKNRSSHSFDSSVFSSRGLELLQSSSKSEQAIILLDEIGGVELLEDDFFDELLRVLELPNKIVGVYKSDKNFQRQQLDQSEKNAILSHRQRLAKKINEQGLLMTLKEDNRLQVENQLKKFMLS